MADSRREMPLRARLALLAAGFVVFLGALAAWIGGFLLTGPPTVSAAKVVQSASGPQAYLTLQTVGAFGHSPRPTWVSYLILDSHGKWVHSTVFQVPAHATVHVTVQQYDSAGLLRNPVWARITGTAGGSATYTGLVGSTTYKSPKALTQLDPGDAGHTFAIPEIGLNVPLTGVSSTATNICSAAPCDFSSAHDVVQFSFKTGAPTIYHWQCFVPCGLNYLNGNGGPMQTLGYMMGFLKVV